MGNIYKTVMKGSLHMNDSSEHVSSVLSWQNEEKENEADREIIQGDNGNIPFEQRSNLKWYHSLSFQVVERLLNFVS